MHTYSVWAPTAQQVQVEVHRSSQDDPEHGDEGTLGVTGVELLDMSRGSDGWWSCEDPASHHGTDHAFRLDGGDPRPDPRSAWQPEDVHGPSRVFDADRHVWGDGAWAGRDARGGVLYELHVGTFTAEGTLDAAAARLDHLVELGVDVVELLPVAAFPGRWGWGYDGVGLYAVHAPYGGPEALQRFVDAAHQKGLAVALDVVYNHLGPAGNYLGEFGPYFTDHHETPWGQAVNLDDDGSHEVRRFVVDNALRWLRDFHVDALRLDAVHALVDDSSPHLLAQLATEVRALELRVGRPLTLIAESDLNDAAMVTPLDHPAATRDGGPTGTGLPARGLRGQWADDVHHALHSALTGETQGYYADFGSTRALATTLTGVFLHDGRWSTFRERDWGAPVARDGSGGYDGHAFVAYTTTHDQTGNRAAGDRLSATLDDAQLATAQALVLTSALTPMIFMGEEWGATTPWQFFTDHDEELGRLVSEGRAREFSSHGWAAADVPDPQEPETRHRSVLDWDEPASGRGARLLTWTRDLVALRRATPELASGDLAGVTATWSEGSWLVLARGGVRVVVNLSAEEQVVPVPDAAAGSAVLLAWDGARVQDGGVALAGRSTAVLRTA